MDKRSSTPRKKLIVVKKAMHEQNSRKNSFEKPHFNYVSVRRFWQRFEFVSANPKSFK
jgi:hypothetical protein